MWSYLVSGLRHESTCGIDDISGPNEQDRLQQLKCFVDFLGYLFRLDLFFGVFFFTDWDPMGFITIIHHLKQT